MKPKDFVITRVITKDILSDSFNGIRNMFGLRLRNFETKIMLNHKQMLEEMRLRYPKMIWYRVSFNPLVNGSCMINVYGEYNE